MICNYCKKEIITPKKITRGSFGIEILLYVFFIWNFFFIPIIYTMWRLMSKYHGCPNCEVSV